VGGKREQKEELLEIEKGKRTMCEDHILHDFCTFGLIIKCPVKYE